MRCAVRDRQLVLCCSRVAARTHAVGALGNLARNERVAVRSDAIRPQRGSVRLVRSFRLCALWMLLPQTIISERNGIDPIIDLLKHGGDRGTEAAGTAASPQPHA